MLKLILAILLTLGTLGGQFIYTAPTWNPPNGVPVPAFGVNEVIPTPNLYVNAATGSDSNSGSIGSPKATIPRNLGPGVVVQVSGAQTLTYTDSNALHATGTITAPAWIVSDPANPMAMNGGAPEIDGTYLIIDGGTGHGAVIKDAPGNQPTNHITIRNVNYTGGGIGIAPYFSGTVSQIVLKQIAVHNYGNITAGEGGTGAFDAHCIVVSLASYVWIVDSALYFCSGDGVQVNGNPGGSLTTHHIYIGRNFCYGNRQTCAWAKYSSYVVMTQNFAAAMRPIIEPPSSPDAGQYLNTGACFGSQYDARYLVIMQNRCTASENGVQIASYDDTAPQTTVSVVGNYFWNIHDITYHGGTLSDCRSPGTGVIFADGWAGDRLVENNTFSDMRVGVGSKSGGFDKLYFNNIFTGITDADICWETDAPVLTFNGYDNTAVLHPSTSNFNTVIGDPLFVTGTFDLGPGSPMLHAGFANDINFGYNIIHGIPTGLNYLMTPNMGASQLP